MRCRYPRPAVLREIPGRGHVVIEASAGTGKTWVIEHLVVDLLLRAGLTIDQILVVTFTEKATWELRRRVRELIESVRACEEPAGEDDPGFWIIDDPERELLEKALFAYDRAPIQTIHGFCQGVLDEMAFDSGMRFGLTLVDAKKAFHRAFREELREHLAAEAADLLEHDETQDMEKLERLLHDAWTRGYLESRPTPPPEPVNHPARLVDAFLPRIADRLDRDKREGGLIDFEDMLGWARQAVSDRRGGPLLAALRRRYRCALIDEFQDTDHRQWEIFRRVFAESDDGNRLVIVGDPKQAIYGFRHADVHTYRRACRTLAPREEDRVYIRESFRSTSDLIAALNRILDQEAPRPLFAGATTYRVPVRCGDPALRVETEGGEDVAPVTVIPYHPPEGEKGSAGDARRQIGRRMAATLRAMLLEEGKGLRRFREGVWKKIPAKEVFILTRTGAEGIEIARCLREAGVPYAFFKQDGLFQTFEARDVLALLRAIAEPAVRAYQLLAWATPFFGVRWRDLARCASLPETDPLKGRLLAWNALAARGALAPLFDRLLHDSGLVERQLFLADSGRELTNYLHIFEILLEAADRRKLDLVDLIDLLQDYVLGNEEPLGPDGNVQRLESEREAVQIITVHKSKGLEADVVFLYGGLFGHSDEKIFVYHEGDERRLWIGKKDGPAKPLITEEENEEARRLLYVGMTRARFKLYVPFFPSGTLKSMTGYYKHLNARLADVLEAREQDRDLQRLVEIDRTGRTARERSPEEDAAAETIRAWRPPPDLAREATVPGDFGALRRRHAPLVTHSYTSLARREGGAWAAIEPEEFMRGVDAPSADGAEEDLPGGLHVGRFFHEVLERLPFGTVGSAAGFDAWRKLPEVTELFEWGLRRHDLDRAWLDRSQRIVYDALRRPIALGRRGILDGLYRCRHARELEFLYPIPEAAHPLLSGGGGAWSVERGYLKGYVDTVFEHEGLTYFADWKSDRLVSYAREALAAHVDRHYDQQAKIYAVGILRLLGVRDEADYEKRFGGLLYLFLRGMRPDGGPGEGVHFERPAWEQIRSWEQGLREIEPPREEA